MTQESKTSCNNVRASSKEKDDPTLEAPRDTRFGGQVVKRPPHYDSPFKYWFYYHHHNICDTCDEAVGNGPHRHKEKFLASFDGRVFKTPSHTVPLLEIHAAFGMMNRLSVAVDRYGGETEVLDYDFLYQVGLRSFPSPEKIAERINELASFARARELLGQETNNNQRHIKSCLCKWCYSTILLDESMSTPQVYCDYCKRTFLQTESTPTPESITTTIPRPLDKKLKICVRCSRFSWTMENAGYTYIYFPYLGCLTATHILSHACHCCMRAKAKKSLLVNSISVIWIPIGLCAVYRVWSAWRSDKSLDSTGFVQALHMTNEMLLKKNTRDDDDYTEWASKVIASYSRLLESGHHAAEIYYNIGMTLLLDKKDCNGARRAFEKSVQMCGNYRPSVDKLILIVKQLHPARVKGLEERVRHSLQIDLEKRLNGRVDFWDC